MGCSGSDRNRNHHYPISLQHVKEKSVQKSLRKLITFAKFFRSQATTYKRGGEKFEDYSDDAQMQRFNVVLLHDGLLASARTDCIVSYIPTVSFSLI